MAKLSIIVPVYNVALYISECIDSIINQTYRDIEIIIVDDGSTDESPEIVDNLAQSDERITVIHQKNKGLPGARNTGLSIASGEYIGFIDSDDRIKPNMYELLINNIQTHDADLSVCNFLRFSKSSSLISHRYGDNVVNYDNKNSCVFYDMVIDSSCNKLYKLDIIRKHNIQFEDKSIVPQEDFYFLLKYFAHIDKVSTVSEAMYEYRIRKSSITNSKQPDDFIQGSIRIVDKVNEYHKSKNINRDTKEFELYLFINMMQSCINNINQNTPKQIAYIVKYFSSQQKYEQAILQYLKKNNIDRFTFRQIYNTALFTFYKYHLFNIAAFFESLRVKRLRKQSITNTFYE